MVRLSRTNGAVIENKWCGYREQMVREKRTNGAGKNAEKRQKWIKRTNGAEKRTNGAGKRAFY